MKATPYYTHVDDYIDATRLTAFANTNNQFVVLKYANQSARLYGLDLSGRMPLAKTGLGEFGLRGLMNYTKGENRDTGGNLYNIMPLNENWHLRTNTVAGVTHLNWSGSVARMMFPRPATKSTRQATA